MTKKPMRVLVLVHETLVPPESTDGYSPQEIDEWRTEFDPMSMAATFMWRRSYPWPRQDRTKPWARPGATRPLPWLRARGAMGACPAAPRRRPRRVPPLDVARRTG